MKKVKFICISFFLSFLTTFVINAQIKVTSSGDLQISNDRDLQFCHGSWVDWGIEHWDGGLNFKQPVQKNDPNYRLFIRDNNGYVGIGLKPDGLFQITRASNTNYKGIIMGYYGNDIQGRYGKTYTGRRSAYNGDLILNYWAGNVGIGTRTPAYKLDVNGDIRADNVSVTSDSSLKENIETIEDERVNNIFMITGKTYKLKAKKKNRENTSGSQSVVADSIGTAEEIDDRPQIGLLAQEVNEFYPELVYEDEHGVLSLNYNGFIPKINYFRIKF